MPWKRRQKFSSATTNHPMHATVFPYEQYISCYVPCRRILGPLSSHEVAISTSVTAANAKKRLPPMYDIICTRMET
uniref:Uncharacterized protein n=1 Tax=Aegilops tauschii subsp. strangulata TaxID=200361 RepID=A0A453EGF3_AEGTS